jgi:hypothetical protein
LTISFPQTVRLKNRCSTYFNQSSASGHRLSELRSVVPLAALDLDKLDCQPGKSGIARARRASIIALIEDGEKAAPFAFR